MSKKNIARTAIEGGRVESNKFQRRQSNQLERKATRRLMHRAVTDLDCLDDRCFPQREPVRKEFADKLSAPYRWLGKHGAGKTAHEIRGMLLARFDTRSLAGRHLVFDHLMPTKYRERWEIYAGRNYVTQDGQLVRRAPNPPNPVVKKDCIRARQWLKTLSEDHRIGATNDGLGLFIRDLGRFHYVECTSTWCFSRTTLSEYRFDAALGRLRLMQVPWTHTRRSINGSDPVPAHEVQKYRLVRPLTADETRFWNTLSVWQQCRRDLVQSP